MELAGITFAEDEQHQLRIAFDPTAGIPNTPIDAAVLRSFAAVQGYAELAYEDRTLEAAIAKIRRSESCAFVIARRTDARYVVEISTDKMSTCLTVVGECGGKPASHQAAFAALQDQGIVEGIDPAAVERAVADRSQRIQVAAGKASQPGKDAWLEPLVDVNRQRHPHIDASGHVDFHDLGAIPAVQVGEALMRRHPPQPGVEGRNLFGESLPARAGKDLQFAAGLQGSAVSPSDPDLLLAQIAGQPVLQRNGIAVEPVMYYENIDVSVGNIDFPGSIEVRGDIRSGMKLNAGGDVIVHGVIEHAEVSAGGNIKVHGGIIGHPEGMTGAHAAVRISAGGSVSAKFVENSVIEAQQAVHVGETIVQSEVVALQRVVVGGEGKKGRILGGKVRATLLVSADQLGGEGAGRTQVMVGINPLLQRVVDENKRRLEATLKQHEDLSKLVKLLRGNPDKQPLYDKARVTLKKVSEEIADAMERQRHLEGEVKLTDSARIVVGEAVSAGVTVGVGRRTHSITEAMGRGVFLVDAGGELGYQTLARPH